jgi:sugar transferase (PEP-CTERM/EpsH1 system associated)
MSDATPYACDPGPPRPAAQRAQVGWVLPDLLVLAHRIPYPPNQADTLRSYNVLKFLSQRYRVHLGCFVDGHNDSAYLGRLKALCHETCFIAQAPLSARARSVRGFAVGEPLSVPYYRNGTLGAWVARLLQRHPIRTALACSAPMAQYLMSTHGVRRVIDFVDVESEKSRQHAEARRWPLRVVYRREARALLAYERKVAGQFEHSAFVSRAEAALFQRLAPESRDKVAFFNNGVDADYFSPHILHRNPYTAGCTALVVTGTMDYWPNLEAVEWFARQVFAPLRAQHNALRLYIVGAGPAAQVQALGRQDGVVVTGMVPDVRPYLAHAALALAPMRVARGGQNRVLEAMAMQKVVVASPPALEGLSARAGTELLVAADGAEFRRHIDYVLAAGSTRELALAARARVLSDYSWTSNLERLADLLSVPEPERAS